MGNQQNNFIPPLVMFLKDLSNLPEAQLPEGYTIRSFQPGDEASWNEIINDSFKQNNSNFEKDIAAHGYFKPERVLFVCYNGRPVATATAWYNSNWNEDTGYLHMVGALSSQTGKGLGYHVCLAALHQMVKDNRKSSVLNTDDFRIPAIKTYLKLDYKPVVVHENQVERWKNILVSMGRTDLLNDLSY